jgi:hypothetical protein
MRKISQEQLAARMLAENPWWSGKGIGEELDAMTPRAYFQLFFPLLTELGVRRALVLMGPRRVGKTVLIHHAIGKLLTQGTAPEQIAYISVDHPIYNGLWLDKLIEIFRTVSGADFGRTVYVFFDEVQYLKDWQIHLKQLVDMGTSLRITVSGSAAAALSLKSRESGAGRFTDFLLPPLTFYEYLELVGMGGIVRKKETGGRPFFQACDISMLNEHFLQFLNFGGYPEVVFSKAIQANPSRFIKGDIIDKVLLRDLPSLYGISDVQELNRLFTTLAFNSGDEVSLQDLSTDSGVAKNTIKRYIEYLEAAFLIKTVHRIDESARRFNRARCFKVYLTNPSMRTALFSAVSGDSAEMGSLAETAVFSQYFHDENADLYYSRWKKGEVDIVRLNAVQKPVWAVEVKWSDRHTERPGELKALTEFCRRNNLNTGWVTTRTISKTIDRDGLTIRFIPTSELCYTVGYNIIHGRQSLASDSP